MFPTILAAFQPSRSDVLQFARSWGDEAPRGLLVGRLLDVFDKEITRLVLFFSPVSVARYSPPHDSDTSRRMAVPPREPSLSREQCRVLALLAIIPHGSPRICSRSSMGSTVPRSQASSTKASQRHGTRSSRPPTGDYRGGSYQDQRCRPAGP